MKCLIVDDEFSARDALKRMGQWSKFGISCILEAENGRQALQIIEAEQPEIMITDMKMEMMDGAELLQCVSSLPTPPVTLVISGYSDFAFMHRAITSDVVDYLLKPVSANTFNQSLERVVRKYRGYHALEAVASSSERKASIRSAIVNEMSSYPAVQLFLRTHPRYVLFGLRVVAFTKVCREKFNGIPDLFYYMLQCDLETQLEEHFHIQVVRLLGGEIGALTCMVAPKELTSVPEIERMICAILNQIAAQHQICIALGVSAEASGADELDDRLHQIHSLVSRAHLTGRNEVCMARKDEAYAPAPIIDENALKKLLVSGETAQAVEFMLSHLTALKTSGHLCYHTLKKAWNSLQHVLQDQLAFLNMELQAADELTQSQQRLQLEEAICDFSAIGQLLTDDIEPFSACFDNGNKLVHRMRAYVEAHYSEKIGLDTLAKEFFISKEYASRIFSKELGTTFVNYLTNVRLEQACRLLLSSEHSISAIADLTGFKESAYFTRVFQKKYGLTPKEYRRSHGGVS